MVSVTARTEYARAAHQVAAYLALVTLAGGVVALVVMSGLGIAGGVTASVTGALVVVSLGCAAVGRWLPRGAVVLSVDSDNVYFGAEDRDVISRPLNLLVSATIGPVAERAVIGHRDLRVAGLPALRLVFTTGADPDGDGGVDVEQWEVAVAAGDPAAATVIARLRSAAPATPSRWAESLQDTDEVTTTRAATGTTAATGDPPVSGPRIADAGSDEAARRLWEEAVRRHDDVLGGYGPYEIDPALMLAYPAVTDVTLDQVQDFQFALENAGALRTDRYPGSRERADAYQRAVEQLRRAWIACESEGRRIGTAYLHDADQADLNRALRLYRHARGGSTEAEQVAYYGRVRDIVGSLMDRGSLHPPHAAVAELDSAARRMLDPPAPRV